MGSSQESQRPAKMYFVCSWTEGWQNYCSDVPCKKLQVMGTNFLKISGFLLYKFICSLGVLTAFCGV